MGISEELEIKLQRLANRGVRYVEGLSKDDHITTHRRKLKMLTIRGRRLYFALCIIYNAYHLKVPSYISDYLKFNLSMRPVRTAVSRGCNTFLLPTFKTDIFKDAFPVAAVRCWNSLPIEIIESGSIEVFKKRVKNFLFENEAEEVVQSRL